MDKLSQTVEFKRLQEVVTYTCVGIAWDVYGKTLPDEYYHLYEKFNLTDDQRETMIAEQVHTQLSDKFGTIAICMPDFASINDTVTRDCAAGAIHDVVALCIEKQLVLGPAYEFIQENIDLESVWEDLLHMNSGDDEFEREGVNHLFT